MAVVMKDDQLVLVAHASADHLSNTPCVGKAALSLELLVQLHVEDVVALVDHDESRLPQRKLALVLFELGRHLSFALRLLARQLFSKRVDRCHVDRRPSRQTQPREPPAHVLGLGLVP